MGKDVNPSESKHVTGDCALFLKAVEAMTKRVACLLMGSEMLTFKD